MKTTVTKDALLCDGCDYLISTGVPIITVAVRNELFHFHDGGVGDAERHDCFRYWAHGPNIMERSLKQRKYDQDQIDEFLSLMLYRREGTFSQGPGVPRPE